MVDAGIDWGVWEYQTGVFWSVTPPTEEQAIREAEIAGTGHLPVTVDEGYRLKNAWAWGRMRGIEQMRNREN